MNPTKTTIRKVLECIRENSPMTPSEVCRLVGASFDSVKESISFLEDLGQVRVLESKGKTQIIEYKRSDTNGEKRG